MKKLMIVSLIGLIGLVSEVSAQKNVGTNDYTTAIGVKFAPGAFTVKHFFNNQIALEGLGYFYSNAFRVTALVEFHHDIANAEGLRWYIGPGAHVSFVKFKGYGYTYVGIDGVLGLDYKFKNIPLNMSIDWQPSFEFGSDPINGTFKNGPGFTGGFAGIGIRYVIN